MNVFEWGAGSSTIWLAGRVAAVTSCENDERWLAALRERVAANVRLIHEPRVETGDYARAPLALGERFQIVVIDGRDRNRCAASAVQILTDDGVIVWDNTEREEYRTGIEAVMQRGFRRIDFEGLAPITPKLARTTILYRDGNCLGI